MNSLKKKLISLFCVLLILLGIFGTTLNAYALTVPISLDVQTTQSISGAGDKVRFVFTPEASGTYCFKGYSNYDTEAYLYIRETIDGDRVFTQLAYNDDDPDGDTDHNSKQFKLVHFLEAGTTYYFDAGFYNDNRVSGTIIVKLTCLAYENSTVQSITATCDKHLQYYTNGTWNTDTNGVAYFHYNTAGLISATSVTVNYEDGTSLTSKPGETSINGIEIQFKDNQAVDHWAYFDSSTGTVSKNNIFTIKYLDQSYDINIVVDTPPLYTFKGKIVNFNNESIPAEGAYITYNGSVVTRADSEGNFSFSYPSGLYPMVFTSTNGISRNVSVVVSTQTTTCQTPVAIITSDYDHDGFVNIRDYSLIMEKGGSKELFKSQRGLTSSDYPDLTIS